MRVLAQHQVIEAAAKGLKKWCLYLSFHSVQLVRQGAVRSNEEAILKAAPCLQELGPFDLTSFILVGGGILVFPSETAARKAYSSTVGEDGPTKTNPYKGPVKVYACLCGPDGKIRTENS